MLYTQNKQGKHHSPNLKPNQGFTNKPGSSGVRMEQNCRVCGRRNHKSEACSFRECICHLCEKKGHLASVCPQKKTFKRQSNYQSFDQNYLESENYTLYNLDCKLNPILIDLLIENINITFNLDTGASFSIISENVYNKFFKNKILNSTNCVFNLYNGNKLIPLGYIACKVTYKKITNNLTFYVIKDAAGPPLLGRDFFNIFHLKIQNLNYLNFPSDLECLIRKFDKVFSPGIGTFTKGLISINLKNNVSVTPRFFRARPLPFAIKEKVEAELNRLEQTGVISRVNFSEWGTPIVPVLKKDGSVRLCGDFKVTLNPFIEVDQYPLPRINELFVKLQGGIQYSKLDLSSAYQQICLDEKSKKLVTISTHKGLYKFNRAPFGIASIPAKFQKIMESLLEGLEGVIVFIDDILITGGNRKQHLDRLKNVLEKLNNAGLKISLEKCQFFMNEVSYLGFNINKDGLHTSKSKVEALKDAPIPSSITQLKSFLGLINYYGNFVPNLATVLHPLYDLLKDNVEWKWTSECNIAFEKIKKLLTTAPILVHYRPNLPLKLITDASDYGVGAVIVHVFSDKSERPIAYASRTLSTTEKNYSQVEKEGLAMIFALCKFNQYLYGRKFILVTDSKALTTIFHPEKNIPQFSANRLRRWAVILANYQYDIQFVKSKDNNADCLSRLPIQDKGTWADVDINFLNYFTNNKDFPINFQVVKRASENDKLILEVGKCLKSNYWPKEIKDSGKPFYRIRNDLSVEDNCLLWNNRIIIPRSLRENILKQLHLSHMGVVKMKSLARSYFWWPGLSKDIEILAGSCENCAVYKSNPPIAKIEQWPWPDKVWDRIHIDFMGPYLNKQFLIIIDAHSKWVEVFLLNKITSKATIEILRSVFARFGLPSKLVSDNARTFCSVEFEDFLSNNNIEHLTSPPFHPASNGAAENAVKTVKSALRNALGKKSNIDINKILCNFLFDFRNTPHCTTGVSPAYLMFGRNLKTRFDNLLPNSREKANLTEKEVKINVLSNQIKQKRNHAGTRFIEFQINEIVYVRDYRNVQKPTWVKGIVNKKIGKNMYLVLIPELNNITWKRHLNQMRRSVFKESNNGIDTNASVCDSDLGELETIDLVSSSDTSESSGEYYSDNISENEKIVRPKRNIKPVDRLVYK